jgi:hypothetical protein
METFNNRMTQHQTEGIFLRQDHLRELEGVRVLLARGVTLTQSIVIPLYSKDRRFLPKRFEDGHISK